MLCAAHALRLALVAVLCGLMISGAAVADDIEGSEDHPLVGRYEGSEIVGYNVTEYDEANLIAGPFDPYAATGTGAGIESHGGQVFLIYYRLPAGRSTLEVQRNYEQSLERQDFSILFSCSTAKGTCFEKGEPDAGYHLGQAVGDPLTLPKLIDDYVHNWFGKGGRYLLARKNGPNGAIFAGLYLGESDNGNVAVVRVVETKEMETDKIVVRSAAEMDREIEGSGKVDLYTVVFDVDKVDILPESRPTLEEIAKLLNTKPDLNLKIVGHTDNQGSEKYNLDLSHRRAKNICGALIDEYGIESGRLTPEGAGFSQPVASNESPEGQQKNRRVELLEEK